MSQEIFLSHEGYPLKKVVVCQPQKEYFAVTNKQAHNITELANKDLAILQHVALVESMRDFGADVLIINELPSHPNSVFTQDTSVSSPEGYIKLSMGIETRSGEEKWMSDFLDSQNVPCVGIIDKPATVEGGDIILAGEIAFVGVSTRTNQEGAEQIGSLLKKQGFAVRTHRVPAPFLHIGGAMSVIDADTVLSVDGVFPDNFFQGFKVISVPNDGFISGNVITLGNRELIVNKENKAAIKKLAQAGFITHEVDLSEFTKGTGGPSCLIMPLARSF